MSAPAFAVNLLATLLSGFRMADDGNVDPFRFPGRRRPDPVGLRSAARALLSILSSLSAAAASGESLRDEESKRLLLDLCAFRILGGRHYRLPRNDPFFWRCVESVGDGLAERAVSRAGGYELNVYRIEGKSGIIELEAHPMNILNTFLVEEYRLARPGHLNAAGPGDIVVDGGGCWGDTALYFADRIGNGKVFVFEFEPENLAVLRRNLDRNPRLAQKCEIVEYALWDASADHLNVASAGPGTRVVDGAADAATRRVPAITIDAWARGAGVPKIDFIKMDIEGAEVPALDGARGTIRSHAPRLAISTYHSLRDLLTIPALLGSLRSDYEIVLAHATIHAEETIAFARRR